MKRFAMQMNDNLPWINAVGGLGDQLMLTGILKQVIERNPGRRFRLARRTGYLRLLRGHPAITDVGFPNKNDTILRTEYWDDPVFAKRNERPMRTLGRMFGLDAPIEERFFVMEDDTHEPLIDIIPWKARNIVIAPKSISPRKEWKHEKWEELVTRLSDDDIFVIQVGNRGDQHVRGAYSIVGLTTPRQIFSILRRADAVVTLDSFLMHAAHHVNRPAVVLWGATSPKVYGYPEQVHLEPDTPCPFSDNCIGSEKNNFYTDACSRESDHCVDQIPISRVLEAARVVL